MSATVVYSDPDFVDVVWRPDLEAVHLVWHSEYDEGTRVRDAVSTAIDYVNKHQVENWLADISHSRAALSEADLAWINGTEFRDAIASSTLRRFVLMPPLPETGQDTGWIADWEKNTLVAFGKDKAARVASDMADIAEFFRKSEN